MPLAGLLYNTLGHLVMGNGMSGLSEPGLACSFAHCSVMTTLGIKPLELSMQQNSPRSYSYNSDRSDTAEPASSASVRARVLTPFSMSSGDAYSSGLWLQPFLHGMKIMPAGAICAMNKES